MPVIPFGALPDDARVWVFASDRPLTPEECDRLGHTVDPFLQSWKAHGVPLTCARDLRYDRFLLVGVDDSTAPPSGCSIDAMVRELKVLEGALGASLLEKHPVWYRDGEEIHCVDRAAFRALVRQGRVGPDTVVFDNTVTRLGQVRRGAWERPARESWHRRAFFSADV